MQIFLSDHPAIGATLRRSRQAKRLSLRISSLDGRITITGPHFVPESTFQDFLDSKAEWILANHKHIERIMIDYGASVPVLGKPQLIRTTKMRKISVVDDQILVPQPRSNIGAQVKGFLKSLARDHLAQASDHYAQRIGHSYQGLRLRDTRSRWGSCSSDGHLMYSWRLVMAPRDVLNYVAAHEVAHLVEMNHSKSFWAVVQDIYGDYGPPRDWLRTSGNQLHRYDFNS
jgi:predicted metal-dependent hydrolase